MIDVREDIFGRLLEVVATIPNVRSVYRNNEDINETDLPAVLILDGDEVMNEARDPRPNLCTMTPNIIIFHSDPNTATELGTLRRELIKRIIDDPELNQIVKTGRLGNGAIRYLGCQVGHAWLRNLHGALKAQFMFKYTLRPDDL